jgi:hypothetical protein
MPSSLFAYALFTNFGTVTPNYNPPEEASIQNKDTQIFQPFLRSLRLCVTLFPGEPSEFITPCSHPGSNLPHPFPSQLAQMFYFVKG